jgi:hypothetical protein
VLISLLCCIALVFSSTYKNEALGYCLQLPEKYEVEEVYGGQYVEVREKDHDEGICYIMGIELNECDLEAMQQSIKMFSAEDLQSIQSMMNAALPEMMELTIVDWRLLENCPCTPVELEWSGNVEGTEIYGGVLFFLHKNVLYEFIYVKESDRVALEEVRQAFSKNFH